MNSDNINNHSIVLTTLVGEGMGEAEDPPSRFQNLWNEAERLKRENIELEAALDQLVQRIKNSVGPIEMEMGRAMRVQIDKLIVFGGRQSLAQWQLHVLDDWIMSSMDCLQSMGLVDEELSDSMATLQAQTLGFEIDSSSNLSASEQMAMHMEEQVQDLVVKLEDDDPTDEFDEEQDIFKWYEEQFAQSELGYEFGNTDEQTSGDRDNRDSAQSTGAADLDKVDTTRPQTVFKTLFHRVARALHPDKETDPKQRELKQALMAQLLEARRQRDLMSVFQLYQEHVDDTAAFDMQEFAELEKVLCQFIELESQRQLDITTKTDLHDIAYTQFYNDDPDAVDQAISQKITDIKRRKREIEAFSETVTSLKNLKPYLEDRYERLRHYFNST